jgi:hypothetical protein
MSYKLRRNLGIKTYEPKKEIRISGPEAFSWLHIIGSRLSQFGGAIQLFFSGFLLGVKVFFHTRDKFNKMQMNNSKTLDLRQRHIKPIKF